MKLNNKGITLVELIISISLISIVIMFLFRLLVDVRYSDNNTDYNRQNQQKRAIIMKAIQTDFLERKLIALTDTNTQNAGELVVNFRYGDGTTGKLSVYADSLTYQNSDGIEKWLLEKETTTTKYNLSCVQYTTSLSESNLKDNGEFFYVRFTIPINVNAKRNFIDDLEFFYLGEKKDILDIENAFPNASHLGYYNPNQC